MTPLRKLPSIFPDSNARAEVVHPAEVKKSFIPNPPPETGFKNIRFGFLNYNIKLYLNIISGCEGPPGKTGERGEHISICIRFPEESTQSSLEKSLYVIIKTNERIVAAASAYAVLQQYIFSFSIQ